MTDVPPDNDEEQARLAVILEAFREAEALPMPSNLTPPERFIVLRHEDDTEESVQHRQHVIDVLFDQTKTPS